MSFHFLHSIIKLMYVVSVSGFILGSVSSRHLTRSHIMASHPNHQNSYAHLTKIEWFAKVHLSFVPSTSQDCVSSIWIACVRFYDVHNCRVWFGGPTEVWCKSSTTGRHYILLSSIECRVAYSEATVNFGRLIEDQSVLIVSKLMNFGN